MGLLTVSGSPHVHGGLSVKKLMWGVVIAMLPAMLASFYYFGMGAIKVTLVAVASAMLFEYLITKFILKKESTLHDGSAAITGILLAFNVPSNLPIWMIVVGALVAIGIAKMSFGGLGKNPFNPDKTHLHHQLLNLKFRNRYIVLIIIVGAILHSILAFLSSKFELILLLTILILVNTIFIVMPRFLPVLFAKYNLWGLKNIFDNIVKYFKYR